MPRATHIRGVPVRQALGQRQAVHAAQVQAAAVPVLVTAAVDAVAADIGADLIAINAAIVTVDTALADHETRIAALEP